MEWREDNTKQEPIVESGEGGGSTRVDLFKSYQNNYTTTVSQKKKQKKQDTHNLFPRPLGSENTVTMTTNLLVIDGSQ